MEGKEQATLRSERVPWSMKDLNSDLRKGFSLKRNSKEEAIPRLA